MAVKITTEKTKDREEILEDLIRLEMGWAVPEKEKPRREKLSEKAASFL